MARDRLRVNEVFHSIQGESTRAGMPCVFVRLTGCHLRCTYCDTEYAFKEGQCRTIDDLINSVRQYPARLVELTGGEPLLQSPVHDLMTCLCDLGYTVLVETSGACDISACDPRVIRIVDFKTPGSGEVERNLFSNIEHLTTCDEVKFVITDRADYEWAKALIEEHRLADRCSAVLLSPVFEQPRGLEIAGAAGLDPAELADWVLHDPPVDQPVRLQMQMHKQIWAPHRRGV